MICKGINSIYELHNPVMNHMTIFLYDSFKQLIYIIYNSPIFSYYTKSFLFVSFFYINESLYKLFNQIL